jgi:hypothetical protein
MGEGEDRDLAYRQPGALALVRDAPRTGTANFVYRNARLVARNRWAFRPLRLAVFEADDDARMRDEDGISTLLGRYLQFALHGRHTHCRVGQLFRARSALPQGMPSFVTVSAT